MIEDTGKMCRNFEHGVLTVGFVDEISKILTCIYELSVRATLAKWS